MGILELVRIYRKMAVKKQFKFPLRNLIALSTVYNNNNNHCGLLKICSYAFALEETNEREKAEKLLRKSLSMNPKTPWAHHAMSKVEPNQTHGMDSQCIVSLTTRSCDGAKPCCL